MTGGKFYRLLEERGFFSLSTTTQPTPSQHEGLEPLAGLHTKMVLETPHWATKGKLEWGLSAIQVSHMQ